MTNPESDLLWAAGLVEQRKLFVCLSSLIVIEYINDFTSGYYYGLLKEL